MLLSILALATSAWAPLTSSAPNFEPVSFPNASVDVEWMSGRFSKSLARASEEESLLFVYFWASSSQQCQKTWTDSISTEATQLALADFVCFSAPLESEETSALVQKFNVTTLPTMLILNSTGEVEDALLGYHSESLLLGDLARIKSGTDTVSDRRRLSDAAPDDFALRFALAAKLSHVGSKAEGQELYDSIKREDPKGVTVVGARLHLWDVMNAITDKAADSSDFSTFKLKPMYSHLSKVVPAEVIVEGWDWIAEIERARGDKSKVCKAMRKAWPHVGNDEQAMAWGLRTAWYHWENREDLKKSEKSFALKVALRCQEINIEILYESEGEEREERDLEVLDILSRCYLMNSRKKDAIATMEASIETNGSSPDREQFLELCHSGKS